MGNKNRLAAKGKIFCVIILSNDLGDKSLEEVVGELSYFNVRLQVQKLAIHEI